MMKILSASVVLMLTFCCCMSTDATEHEKLSFVPQTTDENIPVDLCYVLCDFSASQGNSLKTIRQNAMKIYRTATLHCEIKYYDINAAQFAKPFFQFDLLIKNANKNSERKKFKDSSEFMGRMLDAALEKKCIPKASSNTCIIRALTNSVQSLSDAARDKNKKIWIIILSDLLEDCTYDFGRVDIDNASFENGLKMLDKMPKAMFTLKDYKNVHIKLTVSSEDNKISSEKLFVFWKKVLAKFDYELLLPVTNELPYWVKNN